MTLKPEKILPGPRLRDQIYESVRGQLRLGFLKPGERLKEVDLAKSVGASRTPVREALFQLARDGLLEERNQGYQLPEYSTKEAEDRLEIRLLLEPSIARHAALRASPQQCSRLKKALADEERLVNSADARQFLKANLGFMEVLFSICENKLLVRSARLFGDQFQYFRLVIFASCDVRAVTIEHHRKIAAAVVAHDGKAAEQAMRGLLTIATEYQHVHPPTLGKAEATSPRRTAQARKPRTKPAL